MSQIALIAPTNFAILLPLYIYTAYLSTNQKILPSTFRARDSGPAISTQTIWEILRHA